MNDSSPMEKSHFSPHDVPGLYDAFGTSGFDDLYVWVMNEISLFQERLSASRTHSGSF